MHRYLNEYDHPPTASDTYEYLANSEILVFVIKLDKKMKSKNTYLINKELNIIKDDPDAMSVINFFKGETDIINNLKKAYDNNTTYSREIDPKTWKAVEESKKEELVEETKSNDTELLLASLQREIDQLKKVIEKKPRKTKNKE
jgi:hypothetical protein